MSRGALYETEQGLLALDDLVPRGALWCLRDASHLIEKGTRKPCEYWGWWGPSLQLLVTGSC